MATAIDKQAHIIKKVNELKDSEFGVTALKMELEGQLRRRDRSSTERDTAPRDEDGNCLECADGQRVCTNCDGDYVAHEGDCDYCGGDGCDDCHGGSVNCYECDEGRQRCLSCRGAHHIDPSDDSEPIAYNFSREADCFNFLMSKLEVHGLARKLTAEERILAVRRTTYPATLYGVEAEYTYAGPLKYAKFYYDGSVDSEFTCTLALDDPSNVFYAPKIVEAWNELVAANGNGCVTTGAGMHMALINTADCHYPSSDGMLEADYNRFDNFNRSMQLLLPAMYFLGSCGEASRGLSYRQPQISRNSHRAAIDFRGGAIEYRLFETCYDTPERILDNVVVMANTIKYWSSDYKPSGIEKVTTSLRFGIDGNGAVSRFFTTAKHIDVLNAGIDKLKPAYLTVRELKQQRNFKLTKRNFTDLSKKNAKQAELEYQDYEERFQWRLECMRKEYEWRFTAESQTPPKTDDDKKKLTSDAKQRAKTVVENERARKTPLERFVQRRLDELATINEGSYTLGV